MASIEFNIKAFPSYPYSKRPTINCNLKIQGTLLMGVAVYMTALPEISSSPIACSSCSLHNQDFFKAKLDPEVKEKEGLLTTLDVTRLLKITFATLTGSQTSTRIFSRKHYKVTNSKFYSAELCSVKLRHYEQATKLVKNLPPVQTKQLFLLSTVKTSGRFFQIFVAFSQSWTLYESQ